MKKCRKFKNCGFIKKYKKDNAYEYLILKYCKGDKQKECKRKEFNIKNGYSPSDEMLPNGKFIKK